MLSHQEYRDRLIRIISIPRKRSELSGKELTDLYYDLIHDFNLFKMTKYGRKRKLNRTDIILSKKVESLLAYIEGF